MRCLIILMVDYRKVELRVSTTRTTVPTQNVVAFIDGEVEPGNKSVAK